MSMSSGILRRFISDVYLPCACRPHIRTHTRLTLGNRSRRALPVSSRDWGAIFRESSRVLYEEVDYMREGKNAERFSENFKDTEWIKAPSINWSRSSGKVRVNALTTL